MPLNAYKCLQVLWAKRAYHKKRSLSSPTAARRSGDPHNLDEISYIFLCESRLEYSLTTRRDICYNNKASYKSRRAMYDDYDLDYTYATDYSHDLDEYYAQDLDEDYARDGQDYESLAYRHYAWYNLVNIARASYGCHTYKAHGTCHIRSHVLWWSRTRWYPLAGDVTPRRWRRSSC